MTTRISAAAAQAQAAAMANALGNNSVIRIYTGSAPATPESAATGTLLVEVAVSSVTSANGVVTGADPASVTAVGTGTAGWARWSNSAGTAVIDMTSVSTPGGGGEIQLSSTSISVGTNVDVSTVTYTVPVA